MASAVANTNPSVKTNPSPRTHANPASPTLYIKGSWPLGYTFERVNQALHRAPDDPMDKTPHLSICGIGKAINTVAILHNVIQDKQAKNDDWGDYTIESLGTATVTNADKPRTQLSFKLAARAPDADAGAGADADLD